MKPYPQLLNIYALSRYGDNTAEHTNKSNASLKVISYISND